MCLCHFTINLLSDVLRRQINGMNFAHKCVDGERLHLWLAGMADNFINRSFSSQGRFEDYKAFFLDNTKSRNTFFYNPAKFIKYVCMYFGIWIHMDLFPKVTIKNSDLVNTKLTPFNFVVEWISKCIANIFVLGFFSIMFSETQITNIYFFVYCVQYF